MSDVDNRPTANCRWCRKRIIVPSIDLDDTHSCWKCGGVMSTPSSWMKLVARRRILLAEGRWK